MDERLQPVGRVEAELGAGLAQLGLLLRGREDGDVEDLGCLQQLLRGRDHPAILVDCRAELFLNVADTGEVLDDKYDTMRPSWTV